MTVAKRGDLAVVHTVSRVVVNGGESYDSHAYGLHVITSITRDGAVKAVRDLTAAPDRTPQPVARMGRHTMVTVPAAVCDLAALAHHVRTVRASDTGSGYVPAYTSPVEVLRDLAPHVSDASAIELVRAAAHRAVRESIDFHRARCARCGIYTSGHATVATDADGCPVAVCEVCPRGVNFTTDYPVGLDVEVTSGYAQWQTTRIDSVIDYVIDGYYGGRSYGVTLAGYGARTLSEGIFKPVHVPAERYAVTRETSQPETTAGAAAQPVETSHTVPADGGDLAQPETSQPVETTADGASSQPATVAQTVEAIADGGEVDMAALTATLAAMGFTLAPDGTVTDNAGPLAGAGLKSVQQQIERRGGDKRGPLTHGDHAELLTALGDRQGSDMMRVAGALDCVGDKPLADKARARLRAKVRAGVRGPEIPAVTDESLSRVTVTRAAQPVARPAGPDHVICPGSACGRKVKVTRAGLYASHTYLGRTHCPMTGKPVNLAQPAMQPVESTPPAPATVADNGQAAPTAPRAETSPTVEVTAQPDTAPAQPVDVPAGVRVAAGGHFDPRPAPPVAQPVREGDRVRVGFTSGTVASLDGDRALVQLDTGGAPHRVPVEACKPDSDAPAQPVETSQPVASAASLADIAAASDGRIIVATVGADGIRPVETSHTVEAPADGGDLAQPVEVAPVAAAPTVPAALAPVTRDEPHLYRADPRSRKDSRNRHRCQCGATYDARRVHLTPRALAEYRAQREQESATVAPVVAPGVLMIEHTTDGGTVLRGTGRGDGTAAVMGRSGQAWGFSRKIGPDGAWYVSGSRGKSADYTVTSRIDRATRALAAAGYRVAVVVHGVPREVDGVPAQPVTVETTTAPVAETSRELAPVAAVEAPAQPVADGGEVDAQPVEAGAAAPVEAETDPGVTYTAAWSPAERTVTVVRDVRGGVSGPFGESPADSREAAAAALAADGYAVTGDWEVSRLGDHWVPLARLPRPAVDFPMPAPYYAPGYAPADGGEVSQPETTADRAPVVAQTDQLAQPVEAPAPVAAAPVVETSQPVEVPSAAQPVADSRDYPHAAILRELAGRNLAGRVKVSRVGGVWCYRAQLRDGGEVTGRAVWVDESARWDVCAVYRAWSFVAVAPVETSPVAPAARELAQPETSPTVPDTAAAVVAGWAADRMPVPVSPAPAPAPVAAVPSRVAAALARVTSRPVPAQPVAVAPAPVVAPATPAPVAAAPVVAPVAVPAAPAGDRGRYAYAPGTRVRATLREVRQGIAAAARAPETAPMFAGVVWAVEADRPTVAQPVGAVVVSVEAPAGVDLAAVWAVVDGIAAQHVPAPVLAAV